MDGFQAVAHVGERAPDDYAHGVIEIGFAHLRFDINRRYDGEVLFVSHDSLRVWKLEIRKGKMGWPFSIFYFLCSLPRSNASRRFLRRSTAPGRRNPGTKGGRSAQIRTGSNPLFSTTYGDF